MRAGRPKFTPGPWTVNANRLSPIIGYDVGDGGAPLPIVDKVYGRDTVMIDGNLRLIAAAPDLYAQVRTLANALQASCLVMTDPQTREMAMEMVTEAGPPTEPEYTEPEPLPPEIAVLAKEWHALYQECERGT